jgi:hypothetical protein
MPKASGVQGELEKVFRKNIPTGGVIASVAVTKSIAGHEKDTAWVKANFSALVEEVQVNAYREYQLQEEAAWRAAVDDVMLPLFQKGNDAQHSAKVIAENFPALDRFFLGLTQGRRVRAGKAFELVIRTLFILLNYPFTSQAVINGQPDFILPSVEHYRRNPMDVIIFTVKRTLRERWRQIVTEGTRGLGFFLATIDEDIAQRDLADMLASRINLVVPTRIKTIREDYQTAANVITFEDFFQYHLDPAMRRWEASKAIERS